MKRVARYVTYAVIFLFGLMLGYFLLGVFDVKSAQLEEQKNTIQTLNEKLSKLPAQPVSATSNIVAVNQASGSGTLNKMTIEIAPGKGRVLINTNPFIEPDTQYSAETALRVAQNITQTDLSDKDVIITFESEAKLVGGPSAGAAMALAAIAAMEGKKVKADLVITGTIEPSGSIGQIGGVLEKAQAAGEAGLKLFIVPRGQGEVTYYEPYIIQKRLASGLIVRSFRYLSKTINLSDFAKDYEMGVLEVSTIEEAAKVALE